MGSFDFEGLPHFQPRIGVSKGHIGIYYKRSIGDYRGIVFPTKNQ